MTRNLNYLHEITDVLYAGAEVYENKCLFLASRNVKKHSLQFPNTLLSSYHFMFGDDLKILKKIYH